MAGLQSIGIAPRLKSRKQIAKLKNGDAVLYTEQDLTDEQKELDRNIIKKLPDIIRMLN